MRRKIPTAAILIFVGVGCFAVAGYCIWAVYDVYETLKFYGLESQYYAHEGMREVVYGYKLGIATFALCGLTSLAVALVVLRRNRILSEAR